MKKLVISLSIIATIAIGSFVISINTLLTINSDKTNDSIVADTVNVSLVLDTIKINAPVTNPILKK